jgi:lysozyme
LELRQQIKSDEGVRLKPYKCSAGKLTIGYGFNLENGIPHHFADMLFDLSIQSATRDAVSIISDYNLKPSWQLRDILIQMCFQLGKGGVLGFKKMLTALEKGDYKTAAKEMLNSDWHRQTPKRCERLANEMANL